MAIIIVLSVLPPSQIAQKQLHCGKDNRENIDTGRKKWPQLSMTKN